MDNRFLNRRGFLKVASAVSVAFGLGTAATAKADQGARPYSVGRQNGGGDDMDTLHEQSVKFFLDNSGKDPEFWGVNMPYTLDGTTRVFEVTCTEAPWETTPGQRVNAMLYNGRAPGPIIRVNQGEQVRVNVHNQMTQSTVIHWHGIHTPNSMDGVGFITQPVIKPGQSFTYEFAARNSGTHMYHSQYNAAEQTPRGLTGAFIIDPADKSREPQVSAEYVMVLNDSGVGLTVNGKSFPSTQPILARQGDRIRIRYLNAGLMMHPMHLHGMYQTVIAKDGAPLAIPYLADTLAVAPGERYDVLVDCEDPGIWAYHCQILTDVDSARGMFGMVTALIIK